MEGVRMNKCKKICQELGLLCHNTQNRVITMMCEKEKCKYLGDYLQGLKVMESLCNYMCLSCCEMEELSQSTVGEFKNKCNYLDRMCGVLKKELDHNELNHLNCNKIQKLCKNDLIKKGKTTHRK